MSSGKGPGRQIPGPHPGLDWICATCGLTFGAHRADTKVPDQCPLTEGGMDWPMFGVTTFRDSGERGDVPLGTKSKVTGAS